MEFTEDIAKQNEQAVIELSRALGNCKEDIAYVSNESIAETIISSLLPSDAENVLHWMKIILKAKYGQSETS